MKTILNKVLGPGFSITTEYHINKDILTKMLAEHLYFDITDTMSVWDLSKRDVKGILKERLHQFGLTGEINEESDIIDNQSDWNYANLQAGAWVHKNYPELYKTK